MAKTIITIQSSKKDDIDLFFQLLANNIAIEPMSFEKEGNHTTMFQLDFKALHKVVTNKTNVTPDKPKQNLSINSQLIASIGLYRATGSSFQEIANKMNEEGYKNSRGNELNKMQVSRLYKQYEEEAKKHLNDEPD